MNKIKGWMKKKIIELLISDIEDLITNSKSNECETNSLIDDSKYREEIQFNELIGHRVEIRHFSQEESIFVNVYAVMESSTHIMSKETGKPKCKSKGVVLIDTDSTVYTLANIYEYEIKKREVFNNE